MWYLMLGVSLYIGVYTFSYGLWEWKRDNKWGATVIFILCALAVGLPVFKIFI